MPLVKIFSTTVNLRTKAELLARIEGATSKNGIQISTLNPEFILEAQSRPNFQSALEKMTDCCIDGTGLYGYLKLWRGLHRIHLPLERYPGATLVNDLFEKYSQGEKSFFLLGGPVGLADETKVRLQASYPHLSIVGSEDGGTINPDNLTLDPDLFTNIQNAKPDILLVGFGAPKQELWISSFAAQLQVPVAIGVGGSFGFYSTKKRAPLWLQKLGLEWLYRSITEKGHLKRAWRAIVLFPLSSLRFLFKS